MTTSSEKKRPLKLTNGVISIRVEPDNPIYLALCPFLDSPFLVRWDDERISVSEENQVVQANGEGPPIKIGVLESETYLGFLNRVFPPENMCNQLLHQHALSVLGVTGRDYWRLNLFLGDPTTGVGPDERYVEPATVGDGEFYIVRKPTIGELWISGAMISG